jgi:hypothetical protein
VAPISMALTCRVEEPSTASKPAVRQQGDGERGWGTTGFSRSREGARGVGHGVRGWRRGLRGCGEGPISPPNSSGKHGSGGKTFLDSVGPPAHPDPQKSRQRYPHIPCVFTSLRQASPAMTQVNRKTRYGGKSRPIVGRLVATYDPTLGGHLATQSPAPLPVASGVQLRRRRASRPSVASPSKFVAVSTSSDLSTSSNVFTLNTAYRIPSMVQVTMGIAPHVRQI